MSSSAAISGDPRPTPHWIRHWPLCCQIRKTVLYHANHQPRSVPGSVSVENNITFRCGFSGGHPHPILQRSVLPTVHWAAESSSRVRQHWTRVQSNASRWCHLLQRLRYGRLGRLYLAGSAQWYARIPLWSRNRTSCYQVPYHVLLCKIKLYFL